MAAQDLTTLATAKQWLPISSSNTADDATIARLVTATSQDFMRATRRPDLLLAQYVEARQGDGSSRMVAFHWPIVSVASLSVAGVSVLPSADKLANGYYFDADIDPERNCQLYLNGCSFSDGATVALTYYAGYTQPGTSPSVPSGQVALPADIEQAVLDWMEYRYRMRPNVGAVNRRMAEGDSVHTELIDAPPNVIQVIERYARQIPSSDRRGYEAEMRSRTARKG